MPLGIEGFTYADLYAPARLNDLYDRFCRDVAAADPSFWAEWDAYRAAPDAPRSPVDVSDLIVRMAPHVSRFVEALFQVDGAAGQMRARTRDLDELFRFKVDFVRKRALPLVKGGAHVHREAGDAAMVEALIEPFADLDPERAIAAAGCRLLDREAALRTDGSDAEKAALTQQVDALKRWCASCLHDPAYKEWVIFRFPETLDYQHLVQVLRPRSELPESMIGPDARLRRRDGFALTDGRYTPRENLSEVHYCVLCHERDKDSCSKGIKDKAGAITNNPLGIPLAGCPLDEKISEMHLLRKGGDAIGALAIIVVDNPMVAGTGHRICNDCMKACIFQKQEPVNIPQIETGVLTDVLKMPYGVEIYGLLTRWNPLHVRRPHALPYNGRNILVVGLGPAGYTLAHYLLNEGFGVVAIDGLKIEPLPPALTGEGTARRERAVPQPIAQWDEIYNRLDERVLEGFGGVSEYGITVRWDKNFLTLLHLLLARRDTLRIYGGVRFGGTLADRGRVGARLRSRRDCRRRRQADRDRHEEQPGARRAQGQRLPDGAAAHRRLQAQRAAEPAGAPAGDRDRRRPDRHRHGHRALRLLPDPGGEDARTLRSAERRAGRGRGTRRLRRGGTGDSRRVPGARPRRAGRAGAGRRRRARRRTSCRSCAAGAASRWPTARR